jgi:hypothetical protein
MISNGMVGIKFTDPPLDFSNAGMRKLRCAVSHAPGKVAAAIRPAAKLRCMPLAETRAAAPTVFNRVRRERLYVVFMLEVPFRCEVSCAAQRRIRAPHPDSDPASDADHQNSA